MIELPTPETDAFAIKFKTPCGEKYWVPVDTARKLERERDEAREALRTLAEHGEKEMQRLTKERDEARLEAAMRALQRDEARKKYDTLAVENMLEVNKLCEERDELLNEIQRLRLDAQREAENHDSMIKELEGLYDKLKS